MGWRLVRRVDYGTIMVALGSAGWEGVMIGPIKSTSCILDEKIQVNPRFWSGS